MSTVAPPEYIANSLLPEGTSLPAGIRRFAAVVEYNGSVFCGWQRQSHSASVQAVVEKALAYVANEPVTLVCAGRTDSGVHATNQVVHFDTAAPRQSRNWLLGANTQLPDSVRLRWVGEVSGQFHARFSATARTYRYVISNEPVRPALFHGLLTPCKTPLDSEAMHRAAQQLLGEHDFSSFRASGCQSRTPFRCVEAVKVWRQQPLVVIEITANAFLHHMVRNIAGVLLAVGRGERTEQWVSELLTAKDRTLGEVTAPSAGLYLVAVRYPATFPLPALPAGPLFVV